MKGQALQRDGGAEKRDLDERAHGGQGREQRGQDQQHSLHVHLQV